MRDIHDRREARHETRQHVHERRARLDREARVASALGRESNSVQRPPDDRSVEQDDIRQTNGDKQGQLRWNDPAKVSLSEKKKSRRKIRVVDRRQRDPFSYAAKQRHRSERDDQRRQRQSGHQCGVQRAARRADEQRARNRQDQRDVPVMPRGPKAHRRQPHHGARGEIDASGNQNRSQGHRQ